MAKNSVSEWSTVSSGNGDIAGLTLGLDMPPSYVNNAMQEMMAQIKQWKDGYINPDTGLPVYQSLTVQNIDVEGIANFKGGLTLDGSYGNNGQVLVSRGSSATPTWGDAFVRGMIMLWSGSTSSVPSGWALCSGANGTPNLRDRFIVGAGGSYAVNATGGSANAVAVSHTHKLTDPGHTHSYGRKQTIPTTSGEFSGYPGYLVNTTANTNRSTTGITLASSGVSGTGKNLPPYYALCYIMKL